MASILNEGAVVTVHPEGSLALLPLIVVLAKPALEILHGSRYLAPLAGPDQQMHMI